MATTTVPLNSLIDQSTRRHILAGFAAAGVLGSASALADSNVDPHLEWEREAKRLKVAVDAACEADDEPLAVALNDARWSFLERIAETPAATLAGLAVQLRYVVDYSVVERLTIDEEPLAVISRAASALDRMAGGRVRT